MSEAPIPLEPRTGPRTRAGRSRDRRITQAGLVVAGGFLAAAGLSLLLPEASRRGLWLPLHLALLGGAGVAIASVLPFFTTALAVVPPAPAWGRVTAITLVAAGAVSVAAGYAGGTVGLAVTGGILVIAGVAILAWLSLRPFTRRLAPPRRLVGLAYGVALLNLAAGATLTSLLLAGTPSLVASWAAVRTAHAWLNVLGFVSLVIAGTMAHLLPTVLGGRVVPRRSLAVALACLCLGPPLVAVGMLGAVDLAARTGAALELGGSLAFALFAAESVRGRGRWSGDRGWHLIVEGHLGSAVGWFVVGVALAAVPVVVDAASPATWSLGRVAGPLVVGWAAFSIAGAWTHLLPAIGPGDPRTHARQRDLLGRAARARFVAANAGLALLTLGVVADAPAVAVVGGVACVASLAATFGLLAAAIARGTAGG